MNVGKIDVLFILLETLLLIDSICEIQEQQFENNSVIEYHTSYLFLGRESLSYISLPLTLNW